MFGASSERYKKPEDKKPPEVRKLPWVRKPSERYPNLPFREERIEFSSTPVCDKCGHEMTDSGLTEESEKLTVIPKKYEIVRTIRAKSRCKCQVCLKTAPLPPSIALGSSFTDEMILDVALSKYCDLIPIERYAAMARRGSSIDIPPHSLIELTHYLASFVTPAYQLLKNEIQKARVVHADETPHKMLAGSSTKSWYLWGFSTKSHCYLEARDARSGDVASEFLLQAECEVLGSDVYSGYGKAIGIANVQRLKIGRPLIVGANCNAHARRYFFKIHGIYPGSKFYLDHFHAIFRLEKAAQNKTSDEILKLLEQMRPRFEAMYKRALDELSDYPHKNKNKTALNYFVENLEGLTVFLKHADVAIDNNSQERLLRSHVVGRKTWYGTHSKLGAKTAATLFSLVESAKLVGVNPREYFQTLVREVHSGLPHFTPAQLIVRTTV